MKAGATAATVQKIGAGVAVYDTIGAGVAIGQSSYNLVTGQFSALDTLGFLPAAGFAAGAARGVAKSFAWLDEFDFDVAVRIDGDFGLLPRNAVSRVNDIDLAQEV